MQAKPLSRRLTGICLIAAPVLTLAGLILTPYQSHSGIRSYQDTIAAHPTQAQIAAIVLEIGAILLVPAVFGLIAYARPAPRWLRAPGGVLAVIGAAILPGLLVTDIYDLALAQELPRRLSVAVANHAGNSLVRRDHDRAGRDGKCHRHRTADRCRVASRARARVGRAARARRIFHRPRTSARPGNRRRRDAGLRLWRGRTATAPEPTTNSHPLAS